MAQEKWAFVILIDIEGDAAIPLTDKDGKKGVSDYIVIIQKLIKAKTCNVPFTICIRCNENTIKEIAPGYSNINSALKNSIYIQKHCETQFNQYDIDISSRKGIHEIIVMGFDNLYDIDKHGFITNGHGKGYSIFPQNETIETDKGKLLSLINIESLYFLNSQSYWAYKNEGREKYLQMDELEKGVLSGIKYCTYNKNYKKAKRKK